MDTKSNASYFTFYLYVILDLLPMKGCIGAIDVCLALMDTSFWNESSEHYFSIHYFHQGLNGQAMCGHNCNFTYFNLVAPGKCPDSIAMQKLSYQMVDKSTYW